MRDIIIDAHSHGLHGKYIEPLLNAGGNWIRKTLDNPPHMVITMPPYADVDLRVEWIQRFGIDFQVVTFQPTMDSNLLPGDISAQLALARAINDNMAHLQDDSKGHLFATASIPLIRFENGGRQEMERAINTLGLKAVTLPSNLRGKPLDLPEFESFWALAASMGIPVYIHPVDAMDNDHRGYEENYGLMHNFGWPFETQLALSSLVFSGIMERYPNLKVVAHHLGGGIPFLWGRIIETYSSVTQERVIGHVLPKPIADYFSMFYYDTAIGGNSAAIKCAYDNLGADNIVFATDAPYGPSRGEVRLATYPSVIKSLGLSEADNKKIFVDNARKMLNLE
ncbi:amidohydrolase family protein [Chloroflexota bacterium]